MSEKIALLFCCGKSINKYANFIEELLYKFSKHNDQNCTTIGINLFPQKFIEKYYLELNKPIEKSLPVDYWMFSDDSSFPCIRDTYNNQELLINGLINEKSIKFLEDNSYKIKMKFYPTNEINLINDNLLYGLHSTPLKAIHFLLKQEYKVVIFGMDNICNNNEWKHFYDDLIPKKKTIDQIIDINYQLNKLEKIGSIYKIEETNNIDILPINFNELLNKRIKIKEKILPKKEIIPVNTNIKLKVPNNYPKNGKLSINGILGNFEVENGEVFVNNSSANILLKMGFKHG